MGAFIDLTGKRFGRLTVIRKSDRRASCGTVCWECICDCGSIVVVDGRSLRANTQFSCGCQRKDYLCAQHNKLKHGGRNERLYRVWRGMKERCFYPKHIRYKDYGGRGITVCEDWIHSYSAFRNWALMNGYDPDAPHGACTLDRINVNGNYEPSNCRWVDSKTQANNRRNNRKEP